MSDASDGVAGVILIVAFVFSLVSVVATIGSCSQEAQCEKENNVHDCRQVYVPVESEL